MKQETGKKKNKWLLPVIIIVALLLIAGIVAAIFLMGGNNEEPAGTTIAADIYWNLDRKSLLDPETGLSIREPGEDGLYHIRFAHDGEVVELIANDKKLVNRIDMMDHMALEVDASGNITNVVATAEVCVVAAENFFVQKMEGNTLLVNSSAALNGMEVPYEVNDATGIYNVSDLAEVPGAVDEVEPMDKVVVLQDNEGKTTHVFIVERMVASDVYWRLEQYYNSTKKITTRVPDAAGVYTIGFAVNGQQVELKCKDVEIVTYIDSLSNNVQCTGLTFDEQGFINGTIAPANAVRGALVSNQFDVTELTETGMTTTRMLPSSNQGSTWTGNFAENCKFYDVTGVSGFVGIEVDTLKLNDRVYVLTNAMGEAQIVFITNRMVESDLYWMVNARMYSSTTKLTTQKPDEKGWYIFEFIKNGKIVKLRTKDIAIASDIHRQANNVPVGFKLDGDVITQVYHYVNVTGGWVVASGATITSISGPIVTVMQSGTTTSLVLNSDCKITNAFDYVEKGFGSYTELKIGDQVRSFRNAAGEIVAVYVVGRAINGQVFWNVTRKYDAAKGTTRTVMPAGHEYEGYYEFVLTTGGKRATKYYTKSKDIADRIDRQYPQSVGLQVKGNIITAAVPAACVVGGATMANYCHAEYWINEGYEFYALYRATGNGTKVKYNRETKIYNVSAGASYIGVQEKDVKLNDQIHVITDTSGTAKYIYIVGQTVEGEPYYNIEQRYNGTLGETTRQPDENGYYVFDKIIYKGKLITLKTKEKAVASEVDSFGIGMGMHVKNGIVTRAFSVASLASYGGATGANYDVMKVSGNKITVKRTRPGASNQGHELVVETISGIKFYDATRLSDKQGSAVKPKVGDRVVMYLNEEGTKAAIGYVTIRHNREGGAYGKCDHCGKTVYWNHWESSFPANANLEKDNDSVHFYMYQDVNLSKQVLAGNDKQTLMHAVLDLNGKTITSKERVMGAWYGATLHVMDSSKAQTGTVIGAGAKSAKGDGAGVVLTTRGGSIVINGGTWKVAEEHNIITDGGILNGFPHADYKAGTITINGGKFYGTDVKGNGGVVASNAPNIIINGGEFFGGEAGNIGGTIACPKAQLTINGGIIHGGKANFGGTISCPNLVINGGTIEAGEAKTNGDCMYVSSSFNVTINGGKVAQVTTTTTWTGKAVITGAPEIGELIVADGKLVDMTGVTGGKITVTAGGAFTTKFANDKAAQAVAKFLTPSQDLAEIVVKDAQIWCQISRCIYGHTNAEHEQMKAKGETCKRPDMLLWKLWSSNNKLPTADGNYILTKDVTTANQTSIAGKDVVIDLNGFDVTYQIPAPRTKDFRVFYVNDANNSNGSVKGAKPGSLIITDNSTDDVSKQGTVTAINPAYEANPANVETWTADGQLQADLAYTTDKAAIEAYVKTKVEADLVKLAETDAKAEAKKQAFAKAEEAALKKGAEGSKEYNAEYSATYAAEYSDLYETEYEKILKNYKDTEFQTRVDAQVKSMTDAAAANIAALQAEAEAATQGTFANEEARKAAVAAKYEELLAAAKKAIVDKHVEDVKASKKKLHEAAENGMLVQVANGHFQLLGGNLDASKLETKKSGTAIYVNPILDTMSADSQTVLIENGTVSGGKTTGAGGTIYMCAKSKLTVTGGAINGGVLDGENAAHGAAIYGAGAADIQIIGGTVNGGTNKLAGGNSGAIYLDDTNGKVLIAGNAVVNPGTAANGDSMYIRFGDWTFGGNAVINGGVHYSSRTAANVTITGAPTIRKMEGGSAYSVKLNTHADNNKIKFENLEAGAKIALTSGGIVSAQGDAAQLKSWIDAGYFVNETGAGDLMVHENAIAIYESYCIYGHTKADHDANACGEELLLWQAWTATNALPTTSGNYYVPAGSTINLDGQCEIINVDGTDYANGTVVNVKLDLRGSTVKVNGENTRALMLKAHPDSQYVITSTTEQKATFVSTATTQTSIANGFIYANGGKVRLINIKVDTTSVASGTTYSTVGHVLANGIFEAENCELKGGYSSSGRVLYQVPSGDGKGANLILKNTTVEGGVYVNGTATKTQLEGIVKLLPGTGTYGLKGANAAATFTCTNLAAGSEIHALNCQYRFADEAAALAAKDVIIKAAEGFRIVQDTAEATDLVAEAKPIYQCVYGHTVHEGETASCTEPIEPWTMWTDMTALPTANGNYYVAEGSTINLGSQYIIVDESRAIDIKIDLRGSTVKMTKATRGMLVKGGAGSKVVLTSTTDRATFMSTQDGGLAAADGFIYLNQNANVRLINMKVDNSSYVTAANNGQTVFYVNDTTTSFTAENCEIIGGASSTGYVIQQKSANAPAVNLTLKDTTISGGLLVNYSGLKISLEGVVKLLPGKNTYGLMGTNAAATFNCTELAAGSEIVAANCLYRFADAAAATAAKNDGIIKPIAGMEVAENGNKLIVQEPPVIRCIYGHTTHEGITCSETELLQWTKWTDTTKLPDTNGNYYLPADLQLTAETALTDETATYNVVLDLCGHTVSATNGNRLLNMTGATGSKYTITDTVGGGELNTTHDTNTAGNGALLYVKSGTFRLVNLTVDTTSVVNNTSQASVAYLAGTSSAKSYFYAENCVIKAGVGAQKPIYGPRANTDTANVNTANAGVITIASIAVKTAPATTTYPVGTAVDLTGIELTVTYSDNSTKDVSNVADQILVTDYDELAVGDQTITLTYRGVSTTLAITTTN